MMFGWNFVHKNSAGQTHRQTHTQSNCSENITLPRFRGGIKKLLVKNQYSASDNKNSAVVQNLHVWNHAHDYNSQKMLSR